MRPTTLRKTRLSAIAASLLTVFVVATVPAAPAHTLDHVLDVLTPAPRAVHLPDFMTMADVGYCQPSSSADENCADDIPVDQYNVPTIYYCSSCSTPTDGRVEVFLTISPPGQGRTTEYHGYCDFNAGTLVDCEGTTGGSPPYWADALHGRSYDADNWAVGVAAW